MFLSLKWLALVGVSCECRVDSLTDLLPLKISPGSDQVLNGDDWACKAGALRQLDDDLGAAKMGRPELCELLPFMVSFLLRFLCEACDDCLTNVSRQTV